MSVSRRLSYLKALKVGALVFLGGATLPVVAEAQARGTLQATATVVDTRQGFRALHAARTVVQSLTNSRTDSRIESAGAVATVAQVSLERPTARPSTVVVTIAYSRN